MRTRQIIMLLSAVLGLSSCEKYLDIRKSSTQSQISTAEDCRLLLDNYASLNTEYPCDGNISSDDYYVRATEYNRDGISLEDKRLYIWDGSVYRNDVGQWRNTYNKIYTANLVIEAVDKIRKANGSDQFTLDGLRGAALFIRAFAHWQLAQLYARPYTAATAAQDPGIPYRLEADINDVPGRGTVQETYSRIVQDLQEAAGLLQPVSQLPTRPNKVAAYALLARVYQSMEDYPLALDNASAALELNSQLIDYNTITDTLSDIPFATRFNKEVIFHSVTSYAGILSPNDNGSYVARIDSVLAASYDQDDLRRYILLNQNLVVDESTGDSSPDGTYRFTGNYEPNSSPNFFNGLAVDEVYLIRAESYARAGNTAAAMADLNALLVTRWKAGLYTARTAATTEQALAIVLTERRKELLMRGLRWTDLRRLNNDSRFVKTLSRKIGETAYDLPPNDLKYTLLIPNQVILYGGIAQNPR